MKTTPGPWKWDDDIDSAGVANLTDGYGHNVAVGVEAVGADARLIAAAPELLEALRELMQQVITDVPRVALLFRAADLIKRIEEG